LRISYGTVQGLELSPTARSRPFTLLSEIAQKHQDKPPFDAPDRLLEAIREGRGEAYVDPTLGQVPVDFLSDANITNGNSGSATLNGRGELTGLAFDGTYESVASDWLVLPDARSIYVDIRYVLFLLDEIEHATLLLAELGVTPRAKAPTAPASHVEQTP
jgi:S1-C subfamily serine protease